MIPTRGPVLPATDVLGWAWVLSVVLPASVRPAGTVPWAAVVAVAAGTLGYRVLAVVRPASPVLRGLVWVSGAGLALAALGVVRPAPADITVLSLSAAAAAVAGLTFPVVAAALAAAGLQAWHAGWVVAGGGPHAAVPTVLVESVLVAATSCVTAVVVGRAIRTARARTDGLVAGLLADRRTLRGDEARDRARRAARADLHDTVLTTLSAVGAGWTRGADRAELQAEFARSAAALHGRAPGEDGGVPLLEALRSTAAAPRFAGLRVEVTGAETGVAEPVAAALRLAAGEALTNVVKHAGVDRAHVHLERTGDHVEVTVRDEGPGLPAGTAGGLGLPDSVAGRMTAVGGRALVRGAPGRGTEVVLRAPVDRRPAAVPLPDLWGERGPSTAALWLTGGTSLTGLAGVALSPDRPVGAAGWVLAAVALGTLGVLVATGRFPAPLAALAAVTGPVVLLLAGLPAGGCTALDRPPLTAALGAVVTGLVLVLTRPRREALLALAATLGAYALTAVLAADAGPACTASVLTVATMHLGQVGAAVVVVSVLRRRAGETRDALLADQTRDDERQDADALAGELDRLLPAVRRAVADTVGGLATGALDPADDVVRARCRQDARLVRSLLTQGPDVDRVQHGLVSLAVGVRGRGVDLAVRGRLPAGTLAEAAAEAVVAWTGDVLERLTGAGWRGQAEVTLLATGPDVVLTLVAHDVDPGADGVLDDHPDGAPDRTGDPPWGTPGTPRPERSEGSLWWTVRSTASRWGDP